MVLWFGGKPKTVCKYSPLFVVGMRPKRSFETYMEAMGIKSTHKPYKCPHCGLWHLTSR